MEDLENKLDISAITSFVILDGSPSRKSIRRLLSILGAKPQQVDIAETLEEAIATIEKKKSQILFVDQASVGERLTELTQIQEKSIVAESPKAFFLITSTGSQAQASAAADGEVDAVILRPFTFGDLTDRVVSILEEKFFPDPSQLLINQGTSFFKIGELDKAFECFDKSCKLTPQAILTYAYRGSIRLKQGKLPEAQSFFEEGLKLSPNHYRCLLGLVDLFSELKDYPAAYNHARALSKNHPIPVKRLPAFIKLSILTQKFEDILEFQKLTDEIESVDLEVSTYLAAGLVVCALFLVKQKTPDRAREALKKAERMARGNVKILTRIAIALIQSHFESELNTFLRHMPKEVSDAPEVKLARLEKLKTQNPSAALSLAYRYLKESLKDEVVFRIALELAVSCNEDAKTLQELIEDAVKHFPKLENEWRKWSKLP